MVMTILEGRVTKDNWTVLEQGYQEISQIEEPGLVQSFLIQNSRDTDLWRIVTVWSNREALDMMRRSMETPRGMLIFHQANSEPQLSIFDVQQHVNPK